MEYKQEIIKLLDIKEFLGGSGIDGATYREKIIEMVNEITNTKILKYIYIIISDIMKEI